MFLIRNSGEDGQPCLSARTDQNHLLTVSLMVAIRYVSMSINYHFAPIWGCSNYLLSNYDRQIHKDIMDDIPADELFNIVLLKTWAKLFFLSFYWGTQVVRYLSGIYQHHGYFQLQNRNYFRDSRGGLWGQELNKLAVTTALSNSKQPGSSPCGSLLFL